MDAGTSDSGNTNGDQAGIPLAERDPKLWKTPHSDPARQVKQVPASQRGETSSEKANAAASDGEEADHESSPSKPPFYRRPVLMLIMTLVVITLVVTCVIWWLHSRRFESTDDAFIDGHIIQVSPKVAGQIKRVYIDDNQDVVAGQLLVEIDDRDYQSNFAQAQAALLSAQTKLKQATANVELTQKNTAAQVRQAEAAVSVAKAAIETSKSQAASARADVIAAEAAAKRAEEDLRRYQSLDARAIGQQTIDQAISDQRTSGANLSAARTKVTAAESGIVEAQAREMQAEGSLDAARAALTQVDVAKAEAENAAAEVKRTEAARDRSQLDLEYTRIVAPRAGRVTRRTAEPGAYVPINGALLAIVEPDVWVTANFKETQLTLMKPGDKVDVTVDSFNGRRFTGRVDSIQRGTGAQFSLLPPENATGNYVKVVQRVPVKIVFDPKPDPLLGPGMSVVPKVQVRD